jgi:hypothetical protein
MTAILIGGATALVVTWNVIVMGSMLIRFHRENRGAA